MSMHLHELLERRRNPDRNPRESAVEFVRKYKDDPTMYLHMAPVLKVGIYPRSSSSLDSPAGIYAYRLMDIWEDSIERWNTGEYHRGLSFLPYNGGDHLFILKSDIDPDFPSHFTEADLAESIERLKTLYGISDTYIERLRSAARTNLNFQDCPAGYLWGMTKALVGGVSEFDRYTTVDTMKWNIMLRKLGFVGFNDSGFGVIHGAEPGQALFLTTQAFTVVDHMLQQRKQVVTIGDKTYIGGRVPKHLHLTGIPNVLFLNNTPQDFAKVQTWTVDSIGYHDLKSFTRFLPWNGTGYIKMLGFGNSDRELDYVRMFFTQFVIPKNIHIESIYVGGKFPVMYLNYVPENTPIKKIWISQFAERTGLDRLPQAIQAKIEQPSFK
jgi:hypothetical protein